MVRGHTPLQVSLNGKPDDPIGSLGSDEFLRPSNRFLSKLDDVTCLCSGRIWDVFWVPTGYGPWCKFGERGNVEAGFTRCREEARKTVESMRTWGSRYRSG